MEEYSISKMIGSPPGYIGHEEEGQLTGQLRTNPTRLFCWMKSRKRILRVFDLFLQVFDDGRLTDSKGRTADASNAIFIMTSNISAEKHAEMGFVPSRTFWRMRLSRRWPSTFGPSSSIVLMIRSSSAHWMKSDVSKIVKPMLADICQTLQKQYQVTLQVDEHAEILLAQAGYNPQYGVRELRRTVEKFVQIPLSELIIAGKLTKGSHWQLVRQGEDLAV